MRHPVCVHACPRTVQVLVDQSTYGPLCNLMFMSYATLVLEGRGMRYLRQKIERDFPLVQRSGWKLWPLAALINYRCVCVGGGRGEAVAQWLEALAAGHPHQIGACVLCVGV